MPLRDHFRPPIGTRLVKRIPWRLANDDGTKPRPQITKGLRGRAASSSGQLFRDRCMHVQQGCREGLAL